MYYADVFWEFMAQMFTNYTPRNFTILVYSRLSNKKKSALLFNINSNFSPSKSLPNSCRITTQEGEPVVTRFLFPCTNVFYIRFHAGITVAGNEISFPTSTK